METSTIILIFLIILICIVVISTIIILAAISNAINYFNSFTDSIFINKINNLHNILLSIKINIDVIKEQGKNIIKFVTPISKDINNESKDINNESKPRYFKCIKL